MEQLEGVQNNSADGPQFAQQLSPDQFTEIVQLLNQILMRQSGSLKVNTNSAVGIFITNCPSYYSVANSNSNSWFIDSRAS